MIGGLAWMGVVWPIPQICRSFVVLIVGPKDGTCSTKRTKIKHDVQRHAITVSMMRMQVEEYNLNNGPVCNMVLVHKLQDLTIWINVCNQTGQCIGTYLEGLTEEFDSLPHSSEFWVVVPAKQRHDNDPDVLVAGIWEHLEDWAAMVPRLRFERRG